MRIVEGDKDYITMNVLMVAIATYVAVPVWVWLASGSTKWGVMTFILITYWLNDLLIWPKRKKKLSQSSNKGTE